MTGESSIVTADAAIEFIREQAQASKPFLAVVWFGSPHNPHVAVAEDYAPYAAHGKKKANFYGEIAGIDRAVGKLRRELRRLGIHENTLFWYCSDNGGLPRLSLTGGRRHKGSVYEGGLRVPAIIEWPARIPTPRRTDVAGNTVDIYPTLLEIVGVQPEERLPLDGISLVPLLDGKMAARAKPMGFWDYTTKGVMTPSKKWMSELLKAQSAGDEIGDKARLRLDAGKIGKQFADDTFPGHAAWLDWPWKLHRIHGKGGNLEVELYNLADDPDEKTDLSARQPDRVKRMKADLERWLASVVRSLNGKDYR